MNEVLFEYDVFNCDQCNVFFFFKQKTAYELRISDWSSDVCSSDLISNDPFERQEYWRAVERSERTPKTHEIILDPEASPAWWAELKTTNRLDPAFQHHALMVAESYRQFMDKPLGDDEVRVRFSAQPYIVSAEKAGQLIQQ